MENNEFINICRLCAKEGDPIMIEIFSKRCLKKTISIKSLIESSMNIKLLENELLPNKICSDCLTYLEDFYSYRRKCRKNNDTLITYLEDLDLLSEHIIPNIEKYKYNVSSKKKRTSHRNSKTASNNSKLKSIILKINNEYVMNTIHTENSHLLNNKPEKDCMPMVVNIPRTCETDCMSAKQDQLFDYLNLNATSSNNAPNYDTDDETDFHLHLSDTESCQDNIENSFEKQLSESDSYVCIKDFDKKDINPSLFNIIKESEIKIKKEVFNKNFNCSIQLNNCVTKPLKVNCNQRKRKNSVSSISSSCSSFDEFQKYKRKRKRARVIYDDQFEDDMDDIVTETNNDYNISTEINHTDENFTVDRANQNCLTEINHTDENITNQTNQKCLTEVNHTDEDFTDHANQNCLTEINHTDEDFTADHDTQNCLTEINHTDENITNQTNQNCLTEVNHTDEDFTDHANQNCLTEINLGYFRCSFCDRRYKEEEMLFSHIEGSHFRNVLDKMQLKVSKLPIDVEKAKNATIIVDEICNNIILQNGNDIIAVNLPEKITDRPSQSLEVLTPRIESVFSLSEQQQNDLNCNETIYISDHEENTSKTGVETNLLTMINDKIFEVLLNGENINNGSNNKQNSSEVQKNIPNIDNKQPSVIVENRMFQNKNESSEKSKDDSLENFNKQKSKVKTSKISKLSSPWDNDLRTLLSGTDFCQKYSKGFMLIKPKTPTQTLATANQDLNVQTPEQTTNVPTPKQITNVQTPEQTTNVENEINNSQYESLQSRQPQKTMNQIQNTGAVFVHQTSNRIVPLVISTHSTARLPGIISATNKQIDTEQEVIIIDKPHTNNEFSKLQLLLENQQSNTIVQTIPEKQLLNKNSQLNVNSQSNVQSPGPSFHTSYENFVLDQEKQPTERDFFSNFNQLNSKLSPIQLQQLGISKIMNVLKNMPDEKISDIQKKVQILIENHEKHKRTIDVNNQQNLEYARLHTVNTCLEYVAAKRQNAEKLNKQMVEAVKKQNAETMQKQKAEMLNRKTAEILRTQNAKTVKKQNGDTVKMRVVFAKRVQIQNIENFLPTSKQILPKPNQVLTPQNTTEISFNRTINSQNQMQQNLNSFQETISNSFTIPTIPTITLQQNMANNEHILQRNINYVQNTVMPTIQVTTHQYPYNNYINTNVSSSMVQQNSNQIQTNRPSITSQPHARKLHNFQNPTEIQLKKILPKPKEQCMFSNITENTLQISESTNAQNQHDRFMYPQISNENSSKPSSNVVAHIDLCDNPKEQRMFSNITENTEQISESTNAQNQHDKFMYPQISNVNSSKPSSNVVAHIDLCDNPKEQRMFSNITENNEQISESTNAQNQHDKFMYPQISNVNSSKPSSNVVAHIDLCDNSKEQHTFSNITENTEQISESTNPTNAQNQHDRFMYPQISNVNSSKPSSNVVAHIDLCDNSKEQHTFSNITENTEQISESTNPTNAQNQHDRFMYPQISNVNSSKPSSNVVAHIDLCDNSKEQHTFSNITENTEQISESTNAQNQHDRLMYPQNSNVNSSKSFSNVVAHIDLYDNCFGQLPSYYEHIKSMNYNQNQQNILPNSAVINDANSNLQRSQQNVHVPVNNNVVCVNSNVINSVSTQTSQQNDLVPVENNVVCVNRGDSVNFSNQNRSIEKTLRILSPQAINKRLTNNF